MTAGLVENVIDRAAGLVALAGLESPRRDPGRSFVSSLSLGSPARRRVSRRTAVRERVRALPVHTACVRYCNEFDSELISPSDEFVWRVYLGATRARLDHDDVKPSSENLRAAGIY